jgi:Ca2+-transporting ATPase
MNNWYQLSTTEVAQQFHTDPMQGLSTAEANSRLEQYGPNQLVEQAGRSPWSILREQLSGIMVIILIVAAVVSVFLGDYADAVVILAIVVLNAALGFQQEYKAEQSMAALKQMAVPLVKVRRAGQVQEISSPQLVPGDIVLLETGNVVPADGRILKSVNLRVEEAALTGEAEPIEKEAEIIFETEKPLGDRRNMAFMGTIVNYGHGELLVTETGMQTELGHIANMIQSVEQEPTPLQQRLDRVGKALAVVARAIVAVIFVLGLLRGENWEDMLLTAVSLAVAAVPEAMPAVATIALALGAQRMLKRQALIRKLPAVETLGSVSVICSDKTGTLTKNQMTVTVLDIANHRVDLLQRADGPGLEIVPGDDQIIPPATRPTIDLLLIGGALCNDAVLQVDQSHPTSYRAIGDPTEGALVLAAAEFNLKKGDLDEAFPRVAEVPFDSVRKRMTTLHRTPQAKADLPPSLIPVWERRARPDLPPYLAVTKGAIDSLLEITTEVWVDGRAEPFDENWRQRLKAAHDKLAANGMRILAVGIRPLESAPPKNVDENEERELILVGLIGLMDPPRPEVKAAIETCQSAGIRTVMITGDHPLTARHIAAELGISAGDGFMTGQELDRLSSEELNEAAREVSVFARVSPEHKISLVNIYQEQGRIVAMTGDGVNDAPALKKADIGVAMGITGTDVAKEAADMVLQDDNFATIVAAVEEGRVIYDNIRKFIKYLLSCNSGEIGVMFLGPFLGLPLPLLPLQILWMNLVTDGLPALALGVEPPEADVMRRPPYPAAAGIFDRRMVRDIVWLGLLTAVVALVAGYGYWQADRATWQTMIFTTLTLSQMALALGVRSERTSLFKLGLSSNRSMLGAIALTFFLQLLVIYVPLFQWLFSTVALSASDLLLSVGLSMIVLAGMEVEKWFSRRRGA